MLTKALWIGLAAVALLVFGIGIQTKAEPKLSDYWWAELLGGEVGATAGGFLGGLVAVPKYFSCSMQAAFRSASHSQCLYSLAPLSLGRAVGALVGVIRTGAVWGVEGNILGASLATGLWLVVVHGVPQIWSAIYSTIYVNLIRFWPGLVGLLPPDIDISGIIFVPFVPAIAATIGYNIGAKMKSDKSKLAALRWQLPLVQLRF